ncbi:nucleoid-associated protein [Marinicauda pacifica]|jgi:hypothetical protein|uniref:Nucleoid-associated protein E5162_07120 n=1 Tax=Marinicauda pacifica TaxID=1133559 RepID=A0A4S2HAD6_9PROT|nr:MULTISPECIES: YbaB/EbfC family nucleoid-associated protein [Marinicauda]TGY92836.1 YbaB/EbfC family nucleoid-associated protein [Marinicauda pacifica]GGE40709.1 nucleoid-associated protein [Marinicauda pacifica]
MKDLAGLMKQAQEMQKKMQDAQERLADVEVTGQSGGGMVRIEMTAKGEVKKLHLDKAIVDPEEVEVLEDLLAAALNDARRKADEAQQKVMGEVTQGMGLPPGMDLPFGKGGGPF